MIVAFKLSVRGRKAERCGLKLGVLAGVVVGLVMVGGSAAQAEQYQYDAWGRVTKVTYASGAVVQYSYDAAGNRITVSSTLPAQRSAAPAPSGADSRLTTSSQDQAGGGRSDPQEARLSPAPQNSGASAEQRD